MKRWVIVLLIAFVTTGASSTGGVPHKELVSYSITVSYEINFDVEIPLEWSEGSIASRFNNPGNLRSVNTGRFRSFDCLSDGYEALLYDIECKQTGRSSYADSTTTIEDFIFIYAPPIENNSHLYVHFVCETLGIDRNVVIGSLDKADIARAIIKVEDGVLYNKMYKLVRTLNKHEGNTFI